MPEIIKPVIAVVGFNRPGSLQRLLASLDSANYPADEIELVISLDHCDKPIAAEVRAVAEGFQWRHGTKRLVLHEQNLGLRSHILKCGDLSKEYGSVIVLEDDLTVGPEFYRFAVESLTFTDDQDSIGGVSLYDHKRNFVCLLPFVPLYDGYDNYYLQIASSWGQAWTKTQWESFRNWYGELENRSLEPSALEKIPASAPIPKPVAAWPKSSWLKYFIWYLAETNKLFLYPRFSHTTNHGDAGTHTENSSPVWQVPLAMRCTDFRFSTPEQSLAVYDSFFEVNPEKLKELIPTLSQYDFDVDFYGSKQTSILNRPLVLTSRATQASEMEFAVNRKPFIANLKSPIQAKNSGTFSLTKPENIAGESRLSLKQLRILEYFYGGLPLRTVTKNLIKYYFQK